MKHDVIFKYANSLGGQDRLVNLMNYRAFKEDRRMLDLVRDCWEVVYIEPVVELIESCGRGVPQGLEVVEIGINFLREDCPMEKNTYVLYKGDEVLAVGTMQDIAKKIGVKKETVKYYSMPAYRRKCRGANSKLLVKVIEEDIEN